MFNTFNIQAITNFLFICRNGYATEGSQVRHFLVAIFQTVEAMASKKGTEIKVRFNFYG